jgi:hypothetical protein
VSRSSGLKLQLPGDGSQEVVFYGSQIDGIAVIGMGPERTG